MIDWQQIAALAIVGISAFLLARAEVRRRRRIKLGACGHDCGCTVQKEIVTERGGKRMVRR